MAYSVQMPALGESVTEGTVTRWLKQEGDQVEVDEPLLEVSTDKVDTEIPSPVAGTLLEIIAGEDETVDVGGKLAVIGDASSASDESGGESDEDTADEDSAQESGQDSDREEPAEDGGSQESEPEQKPGPVAPAGWA